VRQRDCTTAASVDVLVTKEAPAATVAANGNDLARLVADLLLRAATTIATAQVDLCYPNGHAAASMP